MKRRETGESRGAARILSTPRGRARVFTGPWGMKTRCINGLLRWTAACLLLAAASSVVLGDDVDDEFGEPMPTRYLTIRVGEYGMGEGQTGIFAGVRASV